MNDIMKWLDEERLYWTDISCKAIQSNIGSLESHCVEQYALLRKLFHDNEELQLAHKAIINELLLSQIHSILDAFDGGAWISEKYSFNIVDKESGEIINEEIVDMHERFFEYLWDKEGSDPFEIIGK